ncbi:MAG: efflux RND transporter periplasmic adaptor subunit [Sphaerochaetaceae bacterium]|jgi:RND family efflux transporter MFP subunit|nr:efflux RND transporter periplasmic adaptor subunit [Sphaerochaetaceae bacterium]
MKIFNKKIKKGWMILVITVLLITGYFLIKPFFKDSTEGYVLGKIDKGEILQQISETGSVRSAENLSLGFKTTGRIESINVSVGDKVFKDQILVNIDVDQLNMQLKNAQGALAVARSQYEKLVNGNTAEDIKIYEDSVNLARQDLKTGYAGLVNVLDDTNIKIYNASSFVDLMKKTYFERGDNESMIVSDNREKIKKELEGFELYVSKIKEVLDEENIVSDLEKIKNHIWEIKTSLEKIRGVINPIGSYQNIISSTDLTLLDTHISYVNTALTSVTSSQQSISSLKIALQKAENTLFQRKASPREEDIDIYLSQISQAEANVNLYESQIKDAYIKSPIDGVITKINGKQGEIISMNQPVINLLSANLFQIKADIYEQDIVNVKIDNPVEVTLIAYPRETIMGKIIAIDPAEKIVDQVVYYEATIDFSNELDGIRSGMTADIVIQTNKKENALRVPKNSVESMFGKDIVQVVNKGKIEEREIKIGLDGDDYYEVISGLNEGEEIIIGKK